jgi:hypothetical protein
MASPAEKELLPREGPLDIEDATQSHVQTLLHLLSADGAAQGRSVPSPPGTGKDGSRGHDEDGYAAVVELALKLESQELHDALRSKHAVRRGQSHF